MFQQLPFQPEPEEGILPDSPPRRTSTPPTTEVGVSALGSGDGDPSPFQRPFPPGPPRWVSQSTRRRRGSPIPASERLACHTFPYYVSREPQWGDVRDPGVGVGPLPSEALSSVRPAAPSRPVLPSPDAIVGHPGDPYLLTEAEMMDIDGLMGAPPLLLVKCARARLGGGYRPPGWHAITALAPFGWPARVVRCQW